MSGPSELPGNILTRFGTLFDREYILPLSRYAIPIALQNFIMSSLNMVGVMMIGQLGEIPVAAVGLANQVFFLLQLFLFGISSGSAMFTAQYWGKKDLHNIRRVLAFGLMMASVVSFFFWITAQLFPEEILSIFSKDPAVVAVGSNYLKIFSWSFLFVGVTFSFGIVLRSIGNVKMPLLVSALALCLNIILSYVLIFGKFGAPQLGTIGAAIAALISRMIECISLVGIIYLRKVPIAIRFGENLNLNSNFFKRTFKPILPVILNESLWSLAITTYFIVYARMGTNSIAAMNIVTPIENMAFVFVSGLANATAIMVGNRIGSGENERAFRFAGRSLTLAIVLGFLIGSQVFIWAPYILSVYKVDPAVIENARRVIIVMSFVIWIRSTNATLVVGVLRSGGDTRFSLFLDGVIIWLFGVPLAIITAFVLHLPIYWVYMAIMLEEALKFVIGIIRYLSRKWIHDLTQPELEFTALVSEQI